MSKGERGTMRGCGPVWARVGPCGRLWRSLPAAAGLPIKNTPGPV
jgi:hypothetical protein